VPEGVATAMACCAVASARPAAIRAARRAAGGVCRVLDFIVYLLEK
jgi:hypothetical protein